MTSEGCDWLIEMLIQDQQSVLIQDHILLGKITVTLPVCTRGLRVMQFLFSVCMYGTCGKIDNKADFDFDFLTLK